MQLGVYEQFHRRKGVRMKYRGLEGYLAHHQIDSMEFNQSQELYGFTGSTGDLLGKIKGMVETEIRIRILIDGELAPSLYRITGKNITALGGALKCSHCGSIWSRGNYVCYNCGGHLDVEPFIDPMDWDIVITSTSISSMYDGLISMELIGLAGSITIDETFPNYRFLPSHTGVIPGYRLCEWCGTVTRKHGNCAACGAHRTPLTELVQMDHECTWCGTKTNNGIVCPACATRVSGVMLKEAI